MVHALFMRCLHGTDGISTCGSTRHVTDGTGTTPNVSPLPNAIALIATSTIFQLGDCRWLTTRRRYPHCSARTGTSETNDLACGPLAHPQKAGVTGCAFRLLTRPCRSARRYTPPDATAGGSVLHWRPRPSRRATSHHGSS